MGTAAQRADRRNDELGRRGEDLAAEYLAGTGLVVLSRNWRCRDGEIDLVATDGSELIDIAQRLPSDHRRPLAANDVRAGELTPVHRTAWVALLLNVHTAARPALRAQGSISILSH
jgi:putative endonuclease